RSRATARVTRSIQTMYGLPSGSAVVRQSQGGSSPTILLSSEQSGGSSSRLVSEFVESVPSLGAEVDSLGSSLVKPDVEAGGTSLDGAALEASLDGAALEVSLDGAAPEAVLCDAESLAAAGVDSSVAPLHADASCS